MSNLFGELNKLEKSDLIETLITRKITADKDETVREFFRELFSNEISESLRRLQTEFDDLRRAVVRLENRSRDNGIESSDDEGDVNGGPRVINDKSIDNGKGQCQSDDVKADTDEMGNETSPTESYTLSQIDHELKQFYRFAKENHLSDQDVAKICESLIHSLRKPFLTTSRLRRVAMFLCATVLLVLGVFYSETLAWHCSAVGRIFLIHLLPVWNWSELKNLRCLMPHFDQISDDATRAVECSFCEFIDKIDVTGALDDEHLSEKFIKLHRPIVLENAVDEWPRVKLEDNFAVLKAIMDDDVLSESFPCKLSTNMFIGTEKLRKVLKGIDTQDSYFVHFENCDFEAVKAFRKYFPRPNFLIPEISPIQYSWLLASNDYHVEKFKPLVLREQVSVVGQIVGRNTFVLVPSGECVSDCGSLTVDLVAGEALILSSYWNLEYKPDPAGENLAVILEAHY